VAQCQIWKFTTRTVFEGNRDFLPIASRDFDVVPVQRSPFLDWIFAMASAAGRTRLHDRQRVMVGTEVLGSNNLLHIILSVAALPFPGGVRGDTDVP